ncbi:MAG: NADH-quinone oxidoreductase subunit L, partial [Hydrogenophaga sp.]
MSNTLSASTLLAVPLAPLVGSAVAGILGTAFGGNVIGRRASHGATILGVLVAFILSAITLVDVIDGARFNATIYEWMVIGGLKMEIGFLVDGLRAKMMVVVTFLSLMVHLYTIGYMP